MSKILAVIKKESLLLWRDKAGLLILFGLPMMLVLFISLIQPSGHKDSQKLKILLLNQDSGQIGQAITKALRSSDQFAITLVGESHQLSRQQATAAVAKGKYQALIIVPSHLSRRLMAGVQRVSQQDSIRRSQALRSNVQILLDSAMPASLANQLKLGMNVILQRITVQTVTNFARGLLSKPPIRQQATLLNAKTAFISADQQRVKPNTVQYSVPAWSLFGMFFIVVPLAGMMVRERAQGVIQRIRVSPASPFIILLGKIITFTVINVVQLVLMLLVGVYILPLFGLPMLDFYNHVGLVLLVGVFAALAATGFGILIGTWARTYQQATTLGPFITIIAAAVGGIFVPVYIMPKVLLQVMNFSPLYWAQSAFIDIFVRGDSFLMIWPSLAKLFAFFAVMLVLSLPPVTYLMHNRKVS